MALEVEQMRPQSVVQVPRVIWGGPLLRRETLAHGGRIAERLQVSTVSHHLP